MGDQQVPKQVLQGARPFALLLPGNLAIRLEKLQLA